MHINRFVMLLFPCHYYHYTSLLYITGYKNSQAKENLYLLFNRKIIYLPDMSTWSIVERVLCKDLCVTTMCIKYDTIQYNKITLYL